MLKSAQPGKVQIPQPPPPPLGMDDGQMPVDCQEGGGGGLNVEASN